MNDTTPQVSRAITAPPYPGRQLGLAQRHAEDILATLGKWRLARRITHGGISGSFEFTGRIAKGLQAALKPAQIHETGH